MDFQRTQLSDPSGDKNINSVSENSSGFCECNICLDSARDPVVTLCGHLYCWPCIYKWLHLQTSSLESHKQPKCPVCKARISNSSLVPLYGRGNSPSSESEPELKRAHQSGLVIPSRPLGPLQSQTQPRFPFRPMTQTSFSSPFVGTVGEMVCGMIFRSPDSGGFGAYPYQNPYPVLGTSSPRARRQVMQVEKSLNRLTIFFFCCFMLCLLLF